MLSRIMLIACLLLSAGCSAKEPAGPPEKVTVACTRSIHSVLLVIAQAKGFFRAEGLDVTLQLHATGKETVQSLVEGRAELAAAADTPIMFALMKGAHFSLPATIETSTRNAAIIARRDRGIAAAADLKGRRIGVALGTNGDYALDSYLTLQGMTRHDLQLVDMQPQEMGDALLQGRVDAVSIWNPLLSTLAQRLGARGILLHSAGAYTETYDVVAPRAFARQRPEAIRRLLRALVKAEAFVVASPRESRQIVSDFCGIDVALLATIWEDFKFEVSLRQSLLLNLENQARWAVKNGLTLQRELPDFSDVIYLDGLRAVNPDAVRIIQ